MGKDRATQKNRYGYVVPAPEKNFTKGYNSSVNGAETNLNLPGTMPLSSNCKGVENFVSPHSIWKQFQMYAPEGNIPYGNCCFREKFSSPYTCESVNGSFENNLSFLYTFEKRDVIFKKKFDKNFNNWNKPHIMPGRESSEMLNSGKILAEKQKRIAELEKALEDIKGAKDLGPGENSKKILKAQAKSVLSLSEDELWRLARGERPQLNLMKLAFLRESNTKNLGIARDFLVKLFKVSPQSFNGLTYLEKENLWLLFIEDTELEKAYSLQNVWACKTLCLYCPSQAEIQKFEF